MIDMKTVRVSEKGQIAIPSDMREHIGIKKGDTLVLIQEGNKILIEPAGRMSKQMGEDFSDLLKLSEKSLLRLWDNKEDEVWDKYLKNERKTR